MVLWFGEAFLIKVKEKFKGGSSDCRKYSQDRRTSTEGEMVKLKQIIAIVK